MKVGLFEKTKSSDSIEHIIKMLDSASIEHSFDIGNDIDFIFSIGGDGTLLDVVPFVKNTEIPILGINFGRLGFLSGVEPDKLNEALSNLKNGNYTIINRQLLHVEASSPINSPFAMNEVTLLRNSFGSMLNIDVFVNDIFLNTYKGDGLIISTPTGSTAYNLSCGGPILLPDGENIILTPIASHTLTVRPIVLHSNNEIKIRISTRNSDETFNINLDARQHIVRNGETIKIYKENFYIKTVLLPNSNFFDTLREKLKWGM
ncbi:NAD kinase [Bacteroidia bacterium]|nr:NAD kinase [Bacteroidia bacterium]